MELFYGGYDNVLNRCKLRADLGLKTSVFTPNAEILERATSDPKFRNILNSADILLPDGIGVYLQAKRSGIKPKERTNGIDFAEKYLERFSGKSSVFLLGGERGVAQKAKKNLERQYPMLYIAGCHHGYFSENETEKIIHLIDRSGADVLFVCMGCPLQEIWISKNLPRLKNVRLAVGLGGSLDVWSGKVKRAPKIMRAAGLEWLWRVCREPKRIKRLPKLFDFAVKSGGNLLQNR